MYIMADNETDNRVSIVLLRHTQVIVETSLETPHPDLVNFRFTKPPPISLNIRHHLRKLLIELGIHSPILQIPMVSLE
jgi:hypothetical protein